MNGFSHSEMVMVSPSLDCTDAAEPPTPTDLITSKAGDRLSYDELLSKYTALHSSNKSLQSNVATLQGQNDYWTKLYTYVERGLALKTTEFNTLRAENQQLKVTDHAEHLLIVGKKYSAHDSIGRSPFHNSKQSITSDYCQTNTAITRSSSCQRFSN